MLKTVFSIIILSGLTGCSKAPKFDQTELQPGGNMTAKRVSHRSYVVEGRGVNPQQKLDFWTGFSLFRDPWVIAPSSTKDRDGLGPLFNTRSCISCHSRGGRGPAPELGLSSPSAMVIRLGLKDQDSSFSHYSKSPAAQTYGEQIQTRAINTVHATQLPKAIKPEAKLNLAYETITGQYDDGSEYQLHKPNYELRELNYGEISQEVGLSPRFAPVVYGAGLLDAIAEADLLAQEDIDDSDQDGISARYNRVPMVKKLTSDDAYTEPTLGIGRFGFKAKHPTLAQQVAAAFRDDIGITSSWFPAESCGPAQKGCAIASELGRHTDVEIPNKLLKLVVDTNQFMAVPPSRNLLSEKAQQGRELFYHGGCASCHTPSYTTAADYPIAVLASQKIWPYTDLALHDMGAGLADGVIENDASGNEWRTPPLWGLGAQKIFRKAPLYLHDGRAKSVAEAILWHGGEAQASQIFFKNLNKSKRQELLTFLDAI
ncbi:di-heme oxidoredictase family protein [Paraglaciecola marina]|uniref:di-heme oxidoreductase family protein n=1 Tax=Paraglaciecola marina TaxID=2500157 RepID=UPI0010619F7D|nr:di-heme oxidoredictase family protein [Paraglaciecola marina]